MTVNYSNVDYSVVKVQKVFSESFKIHLDRFSCLSACGQVGLTGEVKGILLTVRGPLRDNG